MSTERDPTPEQLEQSRDVRVARQQLNRLEIATHYLQQAKRLRDDVNQDDDPELNRIIVDAEQECVRLASASEGFVTSRRRPKRKKGEPTTSCTVYLDECGTHALGKEEAFPVFALAATIIREEDEAAIDEAWRDWKTSWFGRPDVVMHEPEIRHRQSVFRTERGEAAIADLPNILPSLDFGAVCVVLHRPDFLANYGEGPLDSSLPSHGYLMALDFLIERCTFALTEIYGNARATLVAESRGPKEDAQLQYEFARLHLDGTSYVHESWFRQQFHPGIRFQGKNENVTGLQLADLLARPVAEKVIEPESDPDRWTVFRQKLCVGKQTKNSIIGLKVIPWKGGYEAILKS